MNWESLRKKAFEHTTQKLADSVNEDDLIIQTSSAIDELNKASNLLSKRLREWYELTLPEFSRSVGDNEAFARLIMEKPRDLQLKEMGITKSMGAELSAGDVGVINSFAATITTLEQERTVLEHYLEEIMVKYCPNLMDLAGATIGAKLLREARSLERLASIQSSTIQMYGAEKALFRHLKTGAKPPKYGHIINHPLVAKASGKIRGKIARSLADKISIAARVDFFKGDPIGKELRDQLEKKFGVDA